MKVSFCQIYIELGVDFPFSYHAQVFLSNQVTAAVTPSARFIDKYGRDFELCFNISAKRRIKNNQIVGPGVYRKTRDVEYTIFLPLYRDYAGARCPRHRVAVLAEWRLLRSRTPGDRHDEADETAGFDHQENMCDAQNV